MSEPPNFVPGLLIEKSQTSDLQVLVTETRLYFHGYPTVRKASESPS